MNKSQFVKRLKFLRATASLTQAKVYENIGISQTLYEFYESEKHSSIPTYKNLIALANFFNCSIDYLLCQTNNPTRNL